MAVFLDPPLVARNGHTLEVIIVCRVSDPGPGKQDERSLADQEAKHREWLAQHTDLPCNVTVISGTGSGEYLERIEYLQLLDAIASDKHDLVLSEDLGRIVRRIQAHLTCEHCVDHEVRLIATNDNVDTGRPGWQDQSIFSAWHHERSNRDTSDRIKRSHRNRFSQGGCASLPIFGYTKPPGAKSDADWEKHHGAEPIYREWFRMLDEDEARYADVADWLNNNRVPLGEYSRQSRWDGRMVGRITHNLILKGYRYRNDRKSKRDSQGKYRSIKAQPNELLLRHVPHLAFFDEAYFDRIVSQLDDRNGKYRRKGENGRDTRLRVPKKRTRFPGQIIVCGICGRGYVFGGHGQTDHLMCSGAREYRCWNGITVDGPLAAKNISAAVVNAIEALPDYDKDFLQLIKEEMERTQGSRDQELRELHRMDEQLERQIGHLAAFVRDGDTSRRVREDLRQLERDQQGTRAKIQCLDSMPSKAIEIPPIGAMKTLARDKMERLALTSFDFSNLMQKLIPRIVVFPMRLFDGTGKIVLRAHFQLFLTRLLPDPRQRDMLEQRFRQILAVDLFKPPQREAVRKVIVEMRKRMSERVVASELSVTLPAVQRAAALQRKMNALGIDDPFVAVTEPPENYGKLRRHKHKRYHFDPLPDAGQI